MLGDFVDLEGGLLQFWGCTGCTSLDLRDAGFFGFLGIH